jgi:hypothetical protein
MLQFIIDLLYLDSFMIKNEISVIKSILKIKTLSTVFDLFSELTRTKDAFAATIELIKSDIKSRVSPVTRNTKISE